MEQRNTANYAISKTKRTKRNIVKRDWFEADGTRRMSLYPLCARKAFQGMVGVHVAQHGAVSRVRQVKRVSRSRTLWIDAFRVRFFSKRGIVNFLDGILVVNCNRSVVFIRSCCNTPKIRKGKKRYFVYTIVICVTKSYNDEYHFKFLGNAITITFFQFCTKNDLFYKSFLFFFIHQQKSCTFI